MSLTEPPTYAFRREFVDFDELAEEVRQWSLDLFQLDRGAFRGELLQFGIRNVHVSEARFCRALGQKGTPPAGLRTIVVPANRSVHFSWRGEQVAGNDLMIFPCGAELAATSDPHFHVYTCSFPEELLATISDAVGLMGLDDLREDASVLRCSAASIESVRKCLGELCTTVRTCSLPLTDQGLQDHTTSGLPARLLSAIATSHASCAPRTTRKRELALVHAERYVKQHANEDINVRDICRAAQVSQRTLEYAFVERFGLTPKGFLTAYRMNAARRDLRAADATEVKVAEIGNCWGFWHMGQFAADYRKQFGELPSQTLRRAHS